IAGDRVDASIILVIVVASGGLSFWQERSAGRAVDLLLERVRVEVDVLRDGLPRGIPLDDVVPGDVVLLRSGDIVPGDGRITESHSLLIDHAALTGESFPTEKSPGSLPATTPLADRTNAAYMGSHVVSGTGKMLLTASGEHTEFGRISTSLGTSQNTTSFERGIAGFGSLLARATALLVMAVFAVNLLLDRPLIDSFLFSLALAVGLTPQMLPAIVSVTLATGARLMAREQVIVKRLDAIEDFGSMTVLCTDKTGTLTEGRVTYASALDPFGAPSEEIRRLAWLNAHFQRGYANPIDAALLATDAFPVPGLACLGEVPYDFTRKRLSVLVQNEEGGVSLIAKGALEPLLAVCLETELKGQLLELTTTRRAAILDRFVTLSNQGYRVLGVATKRMDLASVPTVLDERDMVFAGFVLFSDPPKPGVEGELAELAALGISVRMITGDNRLAAAHAAVAVGIPSSTVVTGAAVDEMNDLQLSEIAASVDIFAEIEPIQKQRIVRALQASGAVVGFLGDGINDAAALHAADVGISVDTAVDVAKQSAAIVLLEKQLSVIADGVRLGRVTFANTMKYINVTTSANFGNMLSMAAAAAFLPFLPLLPRQILLLNFLSDVPGMTIARDQVDAELVERPQAWDIGSIRSFMILFGMISTVFDLTTFAVLRIGFDAEADLFRSGWFIESTMTELAVMLVLRTRKPFFRSRPGQALLVSSLLVAVITLALPFSPLADILGFQRLSMLIISSLVLITVCYIAATELAKWFVYRRPASHAVNE
ncbi:MAG: magnesium-translocating P-type ATPase, partial [Thermomicrobiales bacterium]